MNLAKTLLNALDDLERLKERYAELLETAQGISFALLEMKLNGIEYVSVDHSMFTDLDLALGKFEKEKHNVDENLGSY